MSQSLQELVRFSELYRDSLERAFKTASEGVGDLGLPRPAFDVRAFRILEARFSRPRLAGKRREAEVTQAIRDLHAPDLYLSIAVCEGVPAALRRFHDWYGSSVHEALIAMGGRTGWVEELSRSLWAALVGSPQVTSQPLLAAYDGRSSLATWLRVVALRAARTSGHRPRGAQRPPPEVQGGGTQLLEPEERRALDRALSRTLTQESVRDRLIFSLSESEGLRPAQAAHLLREDPGRIQRIVTRVRRKLSASVEQILREEHSYDSPSLASYWRRAARVVGTGS